MTSWCEAGGVLADFWRATPRLINLMVAGYRRRRAWLAWHVAALSRCEEMPELDDLAGTRSNERREQSATDMSHNFRLWSAVLAQRNG